MDNQRLFLTISLGLILLLIWQAWEQQHAPPSAAPAASISAPPRTGEVPNAPEAQRATPANEATTLVQGERIDVVTDLFKAGIDTQGGDLRDLRLRRYPVAADTPDVPFQLMSDTGSVFIAQSGLIGRDGDFPNHKTRYSSVQKQYSLDDKANELRVPLSYRARNGVQYTKTYVFRRGSYAVDVEFAVANNTRHEWNGYLYNQFQHSRVEAGGMFSVSTYTGAAIYTPENKYEKISFDQMAKASLKRDTTGGWVAMLQHYFVGAWLPEKSEHIQLYTDIVDSTRYVAGYKELTPTTVAPGQRAVLATRLYAGPKEHKRLIELACPNADLSQASCAENEQTRAPGMELTVDYGVLTVIAAPLFWLLNAIHKLLGNWGWAIIALTVLIKLVFYPLSAASYKSMAQMRKVAPKLEAIKKQHGHDRQALNQAMMELYKVEKINPLGGCLPIVIQIPVFIALYWVLLESVEMRQAPWVLWIKDLSSQDPYYVLPVIMGVTMFLQQRLSPQAPDPMQRKIFMIMPIMFTAMFIFFPAGLVLYWTVNNLLSIAQQWRINVITTGKGKAA